MQIIREVTSSEPSTTPIKKVDVITVCVWNSVPKSEAHCCPSLYEAPYSWLCARMAVNAMKGIRLASMMAANII